MAQRAGVSFELERIDLEGDELVVSGHWSGVRGLRFVRPALVSEDRRILATLEHKPWAPSLDRTWIAAFPWDGDDVDVDALVLDVAPQVTVPLGDGAVSLSERAREPPPATRPLMIEPAPEPPPATRPLMTEPEPEPVPEPPPPRADPPQGVDTPLEALTHERDALRRRLDDTELLARERERRCAHEFAAQHDELVRARVAAERDRDRALAQLDEAVAAREAAVRTRARMERAHDEALQARESAEAKLAAAHTQRDEANAQRDEVLLAYRALQRRVQADRAHEDRARGVDEAGERRPTPRAVEPDGPAPREAEPPAAEPRAAEPRGDQPPAAERRPAEPRGDQPRAAEPRAGQPRGDQPPAAEPAAAEPHGAEEPIGVRTMPAARTVMAELQQRPTSIRTLPVSQIDLWVIRVLATVAGGCFILLLVSILRVLI